MYIDPNFKSKKALREALASGSPVYIFSPGPFPCPQNGAVSVEGPHYPAAHSWYARVEVCNGRVTKLLS